MAINAYQLAVRMLSQREHSHYELEKKLQQRQVERTLIIATLQQLTETGLLDDNRFTEVYVRSRIAKGFGPMRIKAELQQRGINEDLISRHLAIYQEDWFTLGKKIWAKKFKKPPSTVFEHAQQIRYLQYRGFSSEHIKFIFKKGDLC